MQCAPIVILCFQYSCTGTLVLVFLIYLFTVYLLTFTERGYYPFIEWMVKFQHSIDFGPPWFQTATAWLQIGTPNSALARREVNRHAFGRRARAFADQYFDRGSPARWPSFCAAVIFWHPITLDFWLSNSCIRVLHASESGSAQFYFFSTVHAFWQTACCKNRVLKFQHSIFSIKG